MEYEMVVFECHTCGSLVTWEKRDDHVDTLHKDSPHIVFFEETGYELTVSGTVRSNTVERNNGI